MVLAALVVEVARGHVAHARVLAVRGGGMVRGLLRPRRVVWVLVRLALMGSVLVALAGCGGGGSSSASSDVLREACEQEDVPEGMDADEYVEWCVEVGTMMFGPVESRAELEAKVDDLEAGLTEAQEALSEARGELAEAREDLAAEEPGPSAREPIPGQGVKEAGRIAARELEEAIDALEEGGGRYTSEGERQVREAAEAVARFLATPAEPHQEKQARVAKDAGREALASVCATAAEVRMECPSYAFALLAG